MCKGQMDEVEHMKRCLDVLSRDERRERVEEEEEEEDEREEALEMLSELCENLDNARGVCVCVWSSDFRVVFLQHLTRASLLCVFCRSDEAGRSGFVYVPVSRSLRGGHSLESGSAHRQLCPEYARGAVLPAQPGGATDTPATHRSRRQQHS